MFAKKSKTMKTPNIKKVISLMATKCICNSNKNNNKPPSAQEVKISPNIKELST
jgi:hypothetical protein